MGSQLGTLVVPKISGSNPASPTTGQVFYDEDDNTFRGWNGTSWVDLGASGGGGGSLDIDALPAVTALTPADLVAVSQGGTESKATVEQFARGLWVDDVRQSAKAFFEFWNDVGTTTVGDTLAEVNSGTGAATNALASEAGAVGIVQSSTGTTATGRAFVGGYMAGILFGDGATVWEARVRVPTLSDATNRYQLVVGFMDTNTAASQTDGAFFCYDEGGVSNGLAASANWRAVTASNSVRSNADTTVAVAAATWTRLRIEVNAAGTSAAFYINGTLRATLTTNIPTASARQFGFGHLLIKSVGTTARLFDCDYVAFHKEFTTPR